jgi:hypothetical protein
MGMAELPLFRTKLPPLTVDHATGGWPKCLKSFYLYSVIDSLHGQLKTGDDFFS